MNITLPIHGREMTFSEQELIAIVEKHFPGETTQQTVATPKVVLRPTVGEWFEVKPQEIDQKLFEKERDNKSQEKIRKIILNAFAKMNKYPEEYGRNFKTLIPSEGRTSPTDILCIEDASKLGDHIANGVEQALEWAQRISNGETWRTICNDWDTITWSRLVMWNPNYPCLIGGSGCSSASFGYYRSELHKQRAKWLNHVVPLVVAYDK